MRSETPRRYVRWLTSASLASVTPAAPLESTRRATATPSFRSDTVPATSMPAPALSATARCSGPSAPPQHLLHRLRVFLRDAAPQIVEGAGLQGDVLRTYLVRGNCAVLDLPHLRGPRKRQFIRAVGAVHDHHPLRA